MATDESMTVRSFLVSFSYEAIKKRYQDTSRPPSKYLRGQVRSVQCRFKVLHQTYSARYLCISPAD